MSDQNIQVSADYIEAVFQRVSKPMEPLNFMPAWSDRPSKFKIYRDVEILHLPTNIPAHTSSLSEILQRLKVRDTLSHRGKSDGIILSFEEFANCLLFAHGIIGRRLDVNWNADHLARCRQATAKYARGTPSGGGLYPTEIYWSCGSSGPLRPGLYHYSNAHHTLERLYTGDLTSYIRAALGEYPLAQATDQFLLIGLYFWKSMFKYNSFSYHLVTQDLGALLASLRLLMQGVQCDIPFLFLFMDEELNRLCGLETLSESIFVVVPLPTIAPLGAKGVGVGVHSHDALPRKSVLPMPEGALVREEHYQRSKKIISFSIIERVHQAALLKDKESLRGNRGPVRGAVYVPGEITGDERISLPEPSVALLQEDLLTVLARRQSSFGRFLGTSSLALVELATLLAFTAVANTYESDLETGSSAYHLTRLMVIVNRVQDLPKGVYSYDHVQHCLRIVRQGDLSAKLQKHYLLQNYNLAEAGAIIVIVGKPYQMLQAYGNRGYRILNAEVGLAVQHIYMACAALSLNCGATLGFENLVVDGWLDLTDAEEHAMLPLLVGHGLKGDADFDARFY